MEHTNPRSNPKLSKQLGAHTSRKLGTALARHAAASRDKIEDAKLTMALISRDSRRNLEIVEVGSSDGMNYYFTIDIKSEAKKNVKCKSSEAPLFVLIGVVESYRYELQLSTVIFVC